MLEFVFFNELPYKQFLDMAQAHGLQCKVKSDDDSFLVQLSEDTDDTITDELEREYDELMALDQSLTETAEGSAGQHTAGITVELKDGRNVYAKISPALLSKVLQSISHEELNTIINAITEAVEHPDDSRLCQH